MRKVIVLVFSLLAVALLSTGCARSSTSSPSNSPSTLEQKTLVSLVRSGGLDGSIVKLSVLKEGAVIVESNKTSSAKPLGILDAAKMDNLNKQIALANISTINPPGTDTGTDVFVYTLMIGPDTVMFTDANVPPTLVPLMETLNGFLRSGGV